MFVLPKSKATPASAIEYEQTAVITDFITGMNKAIRALPEDDQRRGSGYQLQVLNRWNYNNFGSQTEMIKHPDGAALSDDNFIITDVPDSLLIWSAKNGKKYSYQMTPQEYHEYVTEYLKMIDDYRLQQGNRYSNTEDYLPILAETKTEVNKVLQKRYQQKYSGKAIAN